MAKSTLGTAVYERIGGSVINGGPTNTSALITSGEIGVNIGHATGIVDNFGAI